MLATPQCRPWDNSAFALPEEEYEVLDELPGKYDSVNNDSNKRAKSLA
jgi:hypothetical protein